LPCRPGTGHLSADPRPKWNGTVRALCYPWSAIGTEEDDMAWKKPTLKEVACGMEINMYGPAEDDRRSDDVI